MLPEFSARLLPFDRQAASIAATSLANGLVLVTRNLSDFQPLGVPCLDSWEKAHGQ